MSSGFDKKLLTPIKIGVEKLDLLPPNLCEVISLRKSSLLGLEKEPVVSLRRISVEPFIKTEMEPKPNMLCEPGTADSSKFKLRECSVNVVRDDLEKLKGTLQNNLSILNSFKTYTGDNNSYIHCKVCGKMYTSEMKLQIHAHKKHMIVYGPSTDEGKDRKNHMIVCGPSIDEGKDEGNYGPSIESDEVKDEDKKHESFSEELLVPAKVQYHCCSECVEQFQSYDDLQRHMKTAHKKRKSYLCRYCSKTFHDITMFQVHMNLHCNVCTMFFRHRSKYLKHKSTCFFTVTGQYTCQQCKDNYFRAADLEEHSLQHINPKYYCNVCKMMFTSKCVLAHHFSFLHLNIRPVELFETRNIGNDWLYLCKFCSESSVDKRGIIRHVMLLPDLSNHIIEDKKDYFTCDQCSEKFEAEPELIQHKWSHFLLINNDERKRNAIEETINNDERNAVEETSKNVDNSTSNVGQGSKNIEPSVTNTDVCEQNPILKKNLANELAQVNVSNNTYLNKSPKNKEPVVLIKRLQHSKTHLKDSNGSDCRSGQDLKNLNDNSGIAESKVKGLKNPNDNFVSPMGNKLTDYTGIAEKKLEDLNMINENSIHPTGNKLDHLKASNDNSNVLWEYQVDFPLGESSALPLNFVDVNNITNGMNNEIGVEKILPKPRKLTKTLFSKHQCSICSKYYSSNYCLNRHIEQVHRDIHNLTCRDCEEVFIWPSLLLSHKCVRWSRPEMPYQDARPEILIDNSNSTINQQLEELQVDYDYSNDVDFEIPAPIIDLTESDNFIVPEPLNVGNRSVSMETDDAFQPLANLGYKAVAQEILPIEFT